MEFSMVSSHNDGAQQYCGSAAGDDDGFIRASKVAKFRDELMSKPSSFVNDGQNGDYMLSFSSPNMEDFSLHCSGSGGLETKNLQKSSTFPNYCQHPSSTNSKISGEGGEGGVNNRSMYFLNGVKETFTPAQWIELEQQALIYKYMIANQPIPQNLLIPIKRALQSDGFIGFPAGLFTPNSFGWGGFHLGLFSNSSDPEPGRCRRTDGKKWRCSREAVPDQKYCERHINRGRHRSRKPVEGQNRSGHSVSGGHTPTTKLTKASPNVVNVAPPSSSPPVPRSSACNNFASDHSTSSLVNRLLMNKQNSNQAMQDSTGLDYLSPTINLNSSANTFTSPKDHHNLFAESSIPAGNFGLLTSDPLYKTYASPHDLNDFMSSSTSSPTAERVAELDMGLGVGSQKQQQSNWVPISWESTMGGPLGEALKTSSNNSESLKLGGCASPSPRGVLQQTPLVSHSNSSAGSSPRADNGRAPETGVI